VGAQSKESKAKAGCFLCGQAQQFDRTIVLFFLKLRKLAKL